MREDAVGLDERQFMNAGKPKSNTCMIELANYMYFNFLETDANAFSILVLEHVLVL